MSDKVAQKPCNAMS